MANNKKKEKEKEKGVPAAAAATLATASAMAAADAAAPTPSVLEVRGGSRSPGGRASPKAAAGGGEQQKSRTSRELMENFLTKAATPGSKRPGAELSPGARQQQKKAAQAEGRPMLNMVHDQQMEQEVGGEEDQYGTPRSSMKAVKMRRRSNGGSR